LFAWPAEKGRKTVKKKTERETKGVGTGGRGVESRMISRKKRGTKMKGMRWTDYSSTNKNKEKRTGSEKKSSRDSGMVHPGEGNQAGGKMTFFCREN